MQPFDGGALFAVVSPLMWSALRMLAAVGLLGACAWALMRWKRRPGSDREGLRVLDRACLTRSASLALVTVGDKRLLLGISNDGVRLLTDVDPAEPAEPEVDVPDFKTVLRDASGGSSR